MSPSESTRSGTRRGLRVGALVGAIVAVLVVGEGLWSRASGSSHLRAWTEAQAIPTVAVAVPTTNADANELKLPGRLEAYSRAPIYARTSGDRKRWNVDIGAPVKAGQLLAELETPDLDQQLQQARADLATAVAGGAARAVDCSLSPSGAPPRLRLHPFP